MNKQHIKRQLEQLLFADTERFWLNLYHHKYQKLLDELCDWPLLMNKPEDEPLLSWLHLQSISFIRHKIEQQQTTILELEHNYQLFVSRLSKTDLALEKKIHILNYSQQLGASKQQLKADKRAFARWFDEGAMRDRYQTKVLTIEQSIKFLIARLGALGQSYLQHNKAQLEKTWRTLDLQPFFLRLLAQSQSAHIRHSIIRALVNLVALIQDNDIDTELSGDLIARLVELLEDEDTPYNAIIDILEILIHQRPTFIRGHMWAMLLESIDDASLKNDQLFILAALPRVITRQTKLTDKDINLLQQLSEHSYPRVRQALIEQTQSMPDNLAKQIIRARFENESCDAVRFTVLKQLTHERYCDDDFAFNIWQTTLLKPNSLAIKRIVLEQTPRIMLNMQLNSHQPDEVFRLFISVLNDVLSQPEEIAIKRYVARTREQLASFYNQELIANIKSQLEGSDLIEVDPQLEQHTLGRVLSLLAQRQLGFNASWSKKRWHIRRGYIEARRFWRFLHELRNPSTDKRQGFSHTKTKRPSAKLHVPSCSIAEISETNVPGEALYHLDEHSARPHLPLLDYVLSILSQDHLPSPAHSYTPDGILLITKPTSLFARLRAYWHISWHFRALDTLRKGNELAQQRYLQTLTKLGFKIEFKAYSSVLECAFPVDPQLKSLFTNLSLIPSMVTIASSFKEYAYSVYQNTLSQLMFFVVSFSAYFWGRHLYTSRKIIHNRKAIPVTIGGWGTRGKSGTERLKAALFSALALRTITKTTGCEASLIYSKISGEQFELPIFRPFNKATIWEQSDILAFSKSVKADVFLWECMGLTPRYVKILRRWMKDNFVTITNAYPDHEDILGPSGVDVAREMAAFVGENTQVFTSEQTMAPILEEAAKEKNSTLIQVHWGDGFQITPDIRALYPYDEHPDNIALVCKMAQYIGIQKDFVYKETAERIVPDIGVLQHFTKAKIGHIRQSFVNSMSANERLATIENWQRLALFQLSEQPHIQTIALINNRDDRVARSKVFARIMAEDLCFDYLVVVGTNVSGFYTFFQQAVNEQLTDIIDNNDKGSLSQLLKRFNCPKDTQQLLKRLNVSLIENPLFAHDIESEAALDQALQTRSNLTSTQQQYLKQIFMQFLHADALLQFSSLKEHKIKIIECINKLIVQKTILIHDAHISSDNLTQTLESLACNNQHQLIVGMQNIKGVGLNYVQSWRQWQRVYFLGEQLSDAHITVTLFNSYLSQLASYDQFGVLERGYLMLLVNKLSQSPHAQNEFHQAQLNLIQTKLEKESPKNNSSAHAKRRPIRDFFMQVIESFLEAGAAVKRKTIAQQIYQDIASQHITLERAKTELSKLNQSQKPGWFTAKQK